MTAPGQGSRRNESGTTRRPRLATLVAILGLIAAAQACATHGHPQVLAGASTKESPSGPSISGLAMPKPVSCMSWEIPDGSEPTLEMMPAKLVRQIAEGKGLPAKFYSSGIVPKDFCKPTNGKWRFPLGDQRFYDADANTMTAQGVGAHDRAVIDSIVRRTLASDRVFVKWMYVRGQLVVFSMKPTDRGT